jgi:hypothetical protein
VWGVHALRPAPMPAPPVSLHAAHCGERLRDAPSPQTTHRSSLGRTTQRLATPTSREAVCDPHSAPWWPPGLTRTTIHARASVLCVWPAGVPSRQVPHGRDRPRENYPELRALAYDAPTCIDLTCAADHVCVRWRCICNNINCKHQQQQHRLSDIPCCQRRRTSPLPPRCNGSICVGRAPRRGGCNG